MGKHGDYPRIPRDKYPTSFDAVLPLIPYLRRDGIVRFAERCCGDGDLIGHLESFGLKCVSRGDIVTGQDALKMTVADYNDAQVGITNPPFKDSEDTNPHSTKLMRALIQHFLDLGIPFWLLLPHDFSTNKYAKPFIKHCTDIVVIGRVKWIKGSPYNGGKDNSCWYRFHIDHCDSPHFYNDRETRRQNALGAAAAE